MSQEFFSTVHFQEVPTGTDFENVGHAERETVEEEEVDQSQDTEEAEGEQEASIMSKPDGEVRHQQIHLTRDLV